MNLNINGDLIEKFGIERAEEIGRSVFPVMNKIADGLKTIHHEDVSIAGCIVIMKVNGDDVFLRLDLT